MAAFCAFAVVAHFLSVWNGEIVWFGSTGYVDPFGTYRSNLGIRLINLFGIAVDLSIAFVVISAWRRQIWTAGRELACIVGSLLGTSLVWLELWYGSTFYYGEVRDKQGLPFGVNHGGVLGSLVFLTYLVWRVRSDRLPRGWSLTIRVVITLILPVVHWVTVNGLAERWVLWQS